MGVDFSSGFFRDRSGAEAFLDELKAFCELLVDDEVVVDAAREQCLFYSKWQGLPAYKLQVLDGVYHFGGFERGDFCCFFSTTSIELAFKVLVLRKAPLVRYALRYAAIELPSRRKGWPFARSYGRHEGVILQDVDGYASRLSWVHDLTPPQLLEAYASEDGGVLRRWVTHEERRGANQYWAEWRKSALRLES